MRFCYFGDLRDSGLTPEEALDALQVAEDYGIEAFTPEAVVELVLNQMTLHNCLNLVMHPEIVKHEAQTRPGISCSYSDTATATARAAAWAGLSRRKAALSSSITAALRCFILFFLAPNICEEP